MDRGVCGYPFQHHCSDFSLPCLLCLHLSCLPWPSTNALFFPVVLLGLCGYTTQIGEVTSNRWTSEEAFCLRCLPVIKLGKETCMVYDFSVAKLTLRQIDMAGPAKRRLHLQMMESQLSKITANIRDWYFFIFFPIRKLGCFYSIPTPYSNVVH